MLLKTLVAAAAFGAGTLASPTPDLVRRDGCTLSWNGTDITGLQEGGACRYTVRYATAGRWEYPLTLCGVDAAKFPPACAQPADGRLAPAEDDYQPMSEDCQFMTIYTPTNITKDAKLPIFYWIHGGSYVSGSASDKGLNGTSMAANDNIIVIFTQYRLGVLGHLPPPVAPTGGDPNYALHDIITSLQVIHDNIGAAGGDPAAVTVGGQSAGASMTRALWASPPAKGLYRGFIMHSDPITIGTQGPDETEGLQQLVFNNTAGNGTALSQLNCTDFTCWQNANLSLVLNASAIVNRQAPKSIHAVTQGEVFRPSYGTKTLPQDPANALFYNNSNLAFNISEVPLLITTTRNESGYLVDDAASVNISANDMLFNISLQSFVHNQTQVNAIIESGHYPMPNNSDGLRQGLEIAITDAVWRCATRAVGHQWASRGGRIWIGEWNRGIQYTFDDGTYCSGNNVVCHGDDVYPTFNSQPADKNSEDEYGAWGPQIHNFWTSFIKHGDPTKGGQNWTQWTAESGKDDVFNIGQKNEIKDCPTDLWGTEKFPWYWNFYSNDTIVELGYANQTAVDAEHAPQATGANGNGGQAAAKGAATKVSAGVGGLTLSAVLVSLLL